MEYIEVAIRDEFIRLGQAMKLAGILSLAVSYTHLTLPTIRLV